MDEDTYTGMFPQNSESIELKPWQAPMVEELAIDQTENGFTDPSSDADFGFS